VTEQMVMEVRYTPNDTYGYGTYEIYMCPTIVHHFRRGEESSEPIKVASFTAGNPTDIPRIEIHDADGGISGLRSSTFYKMISQISEYWIRDSGG